MDLDDTAVIVADCSDSHMGSAQTKMHPFFKNITLMKVFENKDKDNIFLVGGKPTIMVLLSHSGDTDLVQHFLKCLRQGYKNVIVLSDGFENVGSFDKVYKQLKNIGIDINAVHFNPVFSPKNFSFKSISDSIVALPFTSEKDIKNIMLFYLLNTDAEAFKKAIRERIREGTVSIRLPLPE